MVPHRVSAKVEWDNIFVSTYRWRCDYYYFIRVSVLLNSSLPKQSLLIDNKTNFKNRVYGKQRLQWDPVTPTVSSNTMSRMFLSHQGVDQLHLGQNYKPLEKKCNHKPPEKGQRLGSDFLQGLQSELDVVSLLQGSQSHFDSITNDLTSPSLTSVSSSVNEGRGWPSGANVDHSCLSRSLLVNQLGCFVKTHVFPRSYPVAPNLEPLGKRPRNLHFTPNHQVILMHTNLRITDLNSFSDKDFWVGFIHFNESLDELVKMLGLYYY